MRSAKRICEVCRSEFYVCPSELGRYCSRACFHAGRWGSTAESRFWSNVQKTGGCWVYQRTQDKGYGVLVVKGKNVRAHRFSWELHFGTIPHGLLVCHKCDNPPCIRPDHLFLGSPADNSTDMANKGRAPGPANPLRGQSNGNSVLKEADVLKIRELYNNGTSSGPLAPMFGVSQATICNIIRRRTWAHI